MKYGTYTFTVKIFFAFAICSFLLNSCASSERMYASGKKKMTDGDLTKAEKNFTKVLSKDSLYVPAIFGLANIDLANGNIDGAISRMNRGLALWPRSYEQHFQLMKWYCAKGDTANALEQMRTLYGDSLYRTRIRQADSEPKLDLIRKTASYRRWHSGIRRLKIQPLDGFSNETDKGTENDQFVTIVSESREIMATVTIQDKNQAYWKHDYVIVDTYIDSLITVTQLDEDYVYCDVLSSGTVDPRATGELLIRATNSHLRLMVSDTDDPVYTSGTALPTTPSLSTTLISIKAKRVLSDPDELDKTSQLK